MSELPWTCWEKIDDVFVFMRILLYVSFILFFFKFLSSVQSRGERPHSSEYLPHAHQRQLRLLPTRVKHCFSQDFLVLCIKMLMSCLQVQQILVNSVYSVVFVESHFRPAALISLPRPAGE